MPSSAPPTSESPPDEALQPQTAPSPRDSSSPKPSNNVIEPTLQEDRAAAGSQTSVPEWARYDQFSCMLAQIGRRRLKQLMQQAREELNGTRPATDGTDGQDGEDNNEVGPLSEEVLSRVLGLLREAERISNVLSAELAMEVVTEAEQEAAAARWVALEMEELTLREEKRSSHFRF